MWLFRVEVVQVFDSIMSGIRRIELINLDCLAMTNLLEGTLSKETLEFFKGELKSAGSSKVR